MTQLSMNKIWADKLKQIPLGFHRICNFSPMNSSASFLLLFLWDISTGRQKDVLLNEFEIMIELRNINI